MGPASITKHLMGPARNTVMMPSTSWSVSEMTPLGGKDMIQTSWTVLPHGRADGYRDRLVRQDKQDVISR